MERYIYNSVHNIVEPLINTHKHGFMTANRVPHIRLSVYDTISKHLHDCKQTDTISMDFSKAFDSVNHRLLINKLHKPVQRVAPHLSGCLLHRVYHRDQYLVHFYF